MSTNHTPTPWKVSGKIPTIVRGPDGHTTIATANYGDNADFIVRACNRDHLFDELVAALQTARLAIQTSEQSASAKRQREVEALREINAALAKVQS